MSFSLLKINKEKVKKVKLASEDDLRPIKGSDLFPELYANIFLNARKKTGKTSAIFKIIKECGSKETTVIVFCSSLNKDATWKSIREMCEKKHYPFIGHTSLHEDGVDQLELLIDLLKEEAKNEEEESEDEEDKKTRKKLSKAVKFDEDSDDEDTKKKKKKPKYRAPEYLIVLDDLSNELKSKSLVTLLKMNRHFKAKIIISSQWLNDLLPESRKQIDYTLVFKGQSKKKLEEIYTDCDISVEMDEFFDIYQQATQMEHSFLYIDGRRNEFRRNFDKLFILD